MTTHLVPASATPALHNAIALWANATTAPVAARRADLLRDKTAMVGAFFAHTAKPPEQVTEIDVKAWQAELVSRGLARATVYGYLSRLSSFYQWAAQDPLLAQRVPRNLVRLARLKAPLACQTESTQALFDQELAALLRVVKRRADAGDLVGKRDYAMLLFYALTGSRESSRLQQNPAEVVACIENYAHDVIHLLAGDDSDLEAATAAIWESRPR